MITTNLVGKIVLIVLSAFGLSAIAFYVWRATAGLKNSLFSALVFRGNLSDLALIYVYPLILFIIIAIIWAIRGINLEGIAVILFMLLVGAMVTLTAIVYGI